MLEFLLLWLRSKDVDFSSMTNFITSYVVLDFWFLVVGLCFVLKYHLRFFCYDDVLSSCFGLGTATSNHSAERRDGCLSRESATY